MRRSQRYEGIIAWFSRNMPVAESELVYDNPYQLLVAVILSAQCTDKRVNMTTPELFNAFPTPQSMAIVEPDDVFPFIKSISYPNNKAKHLVGMARMLVSEYDGIVPEDVKELQKLPGVGRKTANVVASVIYNKEVMPVDTHVFRVSNRIGLTDAKTPLQSEIQLTKGFPAHLLPLAHHWLILHGRYVCHARRPDCENCGISEYCIYFEKNFKSSKKISENYKPIRSSFQKMTFKSALRPCPQL